MDYNQLKELNGLQTQINIILINWDPIDIQKSGKFAHNVYMEYTHYVDNLIERLDSREELTEYLWSIATDITGFDRKNDKLAHEVDQLVKSLLKLKSEWDNCYF